MTFDLAFDTAPDPGTVPLDHDVDGEGPLAVLVHGITENRRSWDPVLSLLTDHYRVLSVDVRGHGSSPTGSGYDIRTLADDVHEVVAVASLDHQAGGQPDPDTSTGGAPPLLVGHSMGGMIVTAYAARHPARAVVNVDQSLDLGGLQAQVQAAEPALRSDAFGEVMDALFGSMRGQLPDPEAQRLAGIRRYDPDVVLGVWGVMLENGSAELSALVGAMTAGVDVPYLSLHGIDPGDGYEAWLRERIPTATVEVWAGLGHHPHLVDPDRFVARLRALDAA